MHDSDAHAVQAAVERFLEAAGRHDYDAIEAMVVPEANIAAVSVRGDGHAVTTMTAREWLARQRSRAEQVPYTEPVHDWTVRIDGGHLAFVRADALLSIGQEPRSRNVDYFTLVKVDTEWRFLSLSYVSTPIQSE